MVPAPKLLSLEPIRQQCDQVHRSHGFFRSDQTFADARRPPPASPRKRSDMATKREFDTDDSSSAKRVKMENGNGKLDPASNPYLAHWNDEPAGKSKAARAHNIAESANIDPPSEDPANSADRLYSFKRHATTAKEATAAEDGPLNPFTGRALSSKYMGILKKRRDLPVHQQR